MLYDRLKRDNLIIYSYKENPIVVVGCPHEVPLHYNTICERTKKRNGDTNSGILGLALFEELKKLDVPSKIIIKSRALHVDPNKDINTDYSQEVLNSKAKLLFEVHGQSSRNNIPLEFSAGKNDLTRLSKLGLFFYEELRQLQKNNLIDYIFDFGLQYRKDKSEAILFRSDGSLTIGELVLPALRSILIDEVENYNMSSVHLESMPKFRFNRRGKLPQEGSYLAKVLSISIYKYYFDSSFKN